MIIALLQAPPAGQDLESNRARGEELCRRAARLGADLALFPEMWSTGYRFPHRGQDGRLRAADARPTDEDGRFVGSFQRLARELGMAIAITYLQDWPGAPRNSVTLVDRHGEIALTYAKVHLCSFDREAALTPGSAFRTVELDTAAGPVKIGAMICYDRELPESARVLMLQGAEILLVPNACEMERHRLAQLEARAFENMVGIALANYPAPLGNGQSMGIHPMAFDRAERSLEMVIGRAGEGEEMLVVEFDLEAMREYRGRETWGNANRKPGMYGELVAGEVQEPFVRRS